MIQVSSFKLERPAVSSASTASAGESLAAKLVPRSLPGTQCSNHWAAAVVACAAPVPPRCPPTPTVARPSAHLTRIRFALKALVVRGLLRRPPLGAPTKLTFGSVHLQNVVAKKRDAATALLQRLHAHMVRLDVDFVGGDFNMAVNVPGANVFKDGEFMAPGPSPLWGTGGLEGTNAVCTEVLCMPRRPYHWRIHKHGVHTFSNYQWASPRETKAHTTRSSCTSWRPTSQAVPVQSSAVTQPRPDACSKRLRKTTANVNDDKNSPLRNMAHTRRVPAPRESHHRRRPRLMRDPTTLFSQFEALRWLCTRRSGALANRNTDDYQ